MTTAVDSWAYVVNFSETIFLIYYGCECLIARSMSSFVFGASRKSTWRSTSEDNYQRPTNCDRTSSVHTARRVHGPTLVARNVTRSRHNTTRVRRNNTCPSAVTNKRSLRPDCTKRTFSRIRADQPTSSEKSVAGSLIPLPVCVDKTSLSSLSRNACADQNFRR